MNHFQFATEVQSQPKVIEWRPIVTFGTEGTEPGKFCRPWGVAIARYSDLSTLWDPWACSDQDTGATSASSSTDTYNEWPRPLGLNFDDHPQGTRRLLNQDLPHYNINNNSTPSTILNTSLLSTYLIGIADRSNNRIQLFKFDAIRRSVTFLHSFGDGPGTRHGQFDRPAGIAFNSKLEQIIVSDKDNHRIQVFDMSGAFQFKFGQFGGKIGQFNYPWDVDVCKGTHNIVVSDTRNRRIQMFNNRGHYVTHFNYPLDSPRGVVFMTPSKLMVSDFNKHRLLMIVQNDDINVTSSTAIKSNGDTKQNSLTSDIQDIQAQKLGIPSQSVIARPNVNQPHLESKFIGLGEGSSCGEFLRPQGVTTNGSLVFCSDSRNNRVACWNDETKNFNYIGGDIVKLDRPAGLASIDNYIVIVDFGNNQVHVCQRYLTMNYFQFATEVQSQPESIEWRRIVTFGSEGTEPGKFCRPWGVAIARYSDLSSLWDPWACSDQDTGATSASSSIDTFNEWPGPFGLGFEEKPQGARRLLNQELPHHNINNNSTPSTILSTSLLSTYLIGIADRSNNRIQLFKFDAIRRTVTFLHTFGDGPGTRHGQFDRPAGIAFNSKLEQIIVSDKDNHRIQVFDISGTFQFKFGERGGKVGQFLYPWDVDVCKATHNIVVSDTRNRRIQLFTSQGRYVTHFNHPLDSPRGVVFMTPSKLMVSDFNKHRLLLVVQTDDINVTSSTPLKLNGDTKTNNNNNSNVNNNNNNNNITSNNSLKGDLQEIRAQSLAIPSSKSIISRPIITQQHLESKFIGLGEGSAWGEFLRPQGVTTNGSLVFCSDSRNNRVACWNKETECFSYIGNETVALDRPAGLASIDNFIVIVDFGNNRVHICQNYLTMNYFQSPTTSSDCW